MLETRSGIGNSGFTGFLHCEKQAARCPYWPISCKKNGTKALLLRCRWDMPNQSWIDRNELQPLPSGQGYRYTIPVDSPWFSGHFPEDPIFPGVALLALLQQALILQAGSENPDARLVSIKRVRFKQMLRPGAVLEFRLLWQKQASLPTVAFEIRQAENLVASGLAVFTDQAHSERTVHADH